MSQQFFWSLLILLTVALNTLAQALLKLGSGQTFLNVFLASGIICYGLSTVLYIATLSKLNLSVAYPIVIGLTMIATTLVGVVYFREKFSTIQGIGVGLMLSGMIAIAIGKAVKF